MPPDNRVLFIHPRCYRPYGRTGQVPMGIIGLMNDLPFPKTGVFAQHLRPGDLDGARVVVMDVHWYFALTNAIDLAHRIKKQKPGIVIIVGGYTATIYAEELLAAAPIDYVLTGDAEGIFRELISNLLEGGSVRHLPNLRWRGGQSGALYTTTPEDYDRLDYYTIDWFPSLNRIAQYLQQRNPYPTFIYPFVPVFKGCISACLNCYGTPANQLALCKRPRVTRGSAAVRRDLDRLSADRQIRLAYMVTDFAAFENRDYVTAALDGRFELDLLYEFCHVPQLETVELFKQAFRRLHVVLSTLRNHAEPRLAPDFSRLPEVIQAFANGRNTITLLINTNLGKEIADYSEKTLQIWRTFPRAEILDAGIINIAVPAPELPDRQRQTEFQNFLLKSRRRSPIGYMVRERMVRFMFTRASTTCVLRKMHTVQNLIQCFFSRLMDGVKRNLRHEPVGRNAIK